MLSIRNFMKWKNYGKPVQKKLTGCPELKKAAASGIVRLTLPRISLEENLMKYDGKNVGIDCLMVMWIGTTQVIILQTIFNDEGHDEPMFELPTPIVYLYLNVLIH